MTAGQWPPPERLDRPAHDSGPGPTATGPSGLGSAAAGPSGPGPRTPRPLQPLQLARALLILFLVRIGLLIMSEFGVEAAVWGRRAMEVRDPLLHTLIGLGTSGLADRKSTRLNSSHVATSYAVFCLKKTHRSAVTVYFTLEP